MVEFYCIFIFIIKCYVVVLHIINYEKVTTLMEWNRKKSINRLINNRILICNLYYGQEATPYLFSLCAEHIIWKNGLDSDEGVKTVEETSMN